MPNQGFLDGKTISRGNNYTSLFMKHSCFLRVGDWRVRMILHLCFKCWHTRGRLWMELEKNEVREKSFLEVLVFGHSYCSSINVTEFNTEHENTCSFPCYIGTSILTFRGMHCAKKHCFTIFCIKFTIYIKKSNF